MATALILPFNYADLATLAASTTASASYGVAMAQEQQRSLVWRSGDGTSSYVDLTRDTEETAEVDYAAVVDCNLLPTGSIRVQSWSDALGGASPGADVTVSPATRASDILASGYGAGGYGPSGYGGLTAFRPALGNVTLIDLAGTFTHRFWRYTFTDADSSFQEAGRLFLAKKFQFSVNPEYGLKLSRREVSSEGLQTAGGQTYKPPVRSLRVLSGAFGLLSDAETAAWLRDHEVLSDVSPVVFSLLGDNQEDSRQYTLYGVYRDASATLEQFSANRMAFEIEERL